MKNYPFTSTDGTKEHEFKRTAEVLEETSQRPNTEIYLSYENLFEKRWRDKCPIPCIGNWSNCSCRQWAASRKGISLS